jgi:hypothetical protein
MASLVDSLVLASSADDAQQDEQATVKATGIWDKVKREDEDERPQEINTQKKNPKYAGFKWNVITEYSTEQSKGVLLLERINKPNRDLVAKGLINFFSQLFACAWTLF